MAAPGVRRFLTLSNFGTAAFVLIACGGQAKDDLFESGGANAGSGATGSGGTGIGATGSGGRTAIGGLGNAGGSSPQAGSTGGGQAGEAGASASGAGGASSGAGGKGGASGKGGAGGAGKGGAAGAGSGGTGGASTCSAQLSELQRLLANAQRCDISLSRTPCDGFVSTLCGCLVPIDLPDSPATSAYLRAFETTQRQCPVPCPAVICPVPARAHCSAPSGQIFGTCVAN